MSPAIPLARHHYHYCLVCFSFYPFSSRLSASNNLFDQFVFCLKFLSPTFEQVYRIRKFASFLVLFTRTLKLAFADR